MKYYLLNHDDTEYILDIAFFVDLITETEGDISPILDQLNIKSIEIPQVISFNSSKIYILDKTVKEINHDIIVIDSIRRHFVNQYYNDYYEKHSNITISFKRIKYLETLFYFMKRYPSFMNDKESAYLDILNSGDVNQIAQLEELLEIGELYDFFAVNMSKIIDEKSIFEFTQLDEMMIGFILYYNNARYDLKSFNLNQQFYNQ